MESQKEQNQEQSKSQSLDASGMTVGQRARVAAVYEFMARALPTEGRDYSVGFSFDKSDPDRISVRFEAHSEIGRIWCNYCREAMRKANSR